MFRASPVVVRRMDVRTFGFALGMVAAVACSAAAQETFDNPEYAYLAKLKKGTTFTMKVVTEAAGNKSESSITTTVVDVAEDKVVVEMTVAATINGMEFKQPAAKRDVPKVVTLPAGVPKPDPTKKPEGVVEEGKETIKVGGTEFKAKWVKTKVKMGDNEFEGKTWTAEEYPGLILKSESTVKGAVPQTVKMELTEFKKP
jgi:hypothetical protein